MFAPGEIVYGYVKHIGKPKYAVSIYRDEDVNILIHFTTSQPRAGVPLELVHHGANHKMTALFPVSGKTRIFSRTGLRADLKSYVR